MGATLAVGYPEGVMTQSAFARLLRVLVALFALRKQG
jgi:hypothetical protein